MRICLLYDSLEDGSGTEIDIKTTRWGGQFFLEVTHDDNVTGCIGAGAKAVEVDDKEIFACAGEEGVEVEASHPKDCVGEAYTWPG